MKNKHTPRETAEANAALIAAAPDRPDFQVTLRAAIAKAERAGR